MARGRTIAGSEAPSTVGSRRVAPWPALLSLILLQAALSFSGAAHMDFVGNYDTAYYYAVARNIALGQLNSDNVVWHWLGTPDSVARPAGDYWSPGWPILLGSVMAVVGHTMKDAMFICASLSLALPLLVFWAAYSIHRDVFFAWLAGLVLIPQERDRESSFMPDVALPHQVFQMLGLCLLLRAQRSGSRSWARWLAAGALLTVPLWLRGEGFVVPAAAAAATLLDLQVPFRERIGRLRWLLLGSAICVVALLGYNLWAFGETTPEPRRLVPYMTSFGDLYLFATDPSYEVWRAQGAGRILARIGDTLLLRIAHPLQEIPIPLLVLAALGAFIGGGSRLLDGRTLPFVLLVILTWFVPAVIAPLPSVNPGRFVQASTPIICLLASLALRRLASRWRQKPLVVWVTGLAFLLGCSIWFWPLQVRNPLSREAWENQFTPIPHYLQPSGHPPLEPDDLVLTTDPCQVAAVLGVPTMMVPMDSHQALREVVARYHPRYFPLPNQTLWWVVIGDQGRDLLDEGLLLKMGREARDGVWYEIVE